MKLRKRDPVLFDSAIILIADFIAAWIYNDVSDPMSLWTPGGLGIITGVAWVLIVARFFWEVR